MTGHTWAVLLGDFLAGFQLISCVHSPWSSEASSDLCSTSPSLYLSPHWYIQEQRQARTRKEEQGTGDRLPEDSEADFTLLSQLCLPAAVATAQKRQLIRQEVRPSTLWTVVSLSPMPKMSQEMGELTQTRLQKIWIPRSSNCRLQWRRGCKWVYFHGLQGGGGRVGVEDSCGITRV